MSDGRVDVREALRRIELPPGGRIRAAHERVFQPDARPRQDRDQHAVEAPGVGQTGYFAEPRYVVFRFQQRRHLFNEMLRHGSISRVRSGAGYGQADAALPHDVVVHQSITIIRLLLRKRDREFLICPIFDSKNTLTFASNKSAPRHSARTAVNPLLERQTAVR